MSYKILITEEAEDDIENLDPVVKKRIRKNLLKLASNPFSYSKKLVGSSEYRFRIGNYRVIFEIYQKTIVILRIGHRREIYK